MALTIIDDIAIHEAGHVLVTYLMSDLAELHEVTIDEEYSKTMDENSGGGLKYKYLKPPTALHFLELDQFCLSYLGGLAADLVNEHEGVVNPDLFSTQNFIEKISHFHYQGDMIALNNKFTLLRKNLQVLPQYYNFISIYLLTDFLSRKEVLQVLLEVRNLIDQNKTVDGTHLRNYLDKSYIANYKTTIWPKVKENRKNLFFRNPA